MESSGVTAQVGTLNNRELGGYDNCHVRSSVSYMYLGKASLSSARFSHSYIFSKPHFVRSEVSHTPRRHLIVWPQWFLRSYDRTGYPCQCNFLSFFGT